MANTSIGTAWIQIKPTTKGLQAAIQKDLQSEVDSTEIGEESGKNQATAFVGAFKKTVVAAAIGKFLKDALSVEIDFSSSMSQVAATLGYSLEELNDPASDAAKTMSTLGDYAQEMGRTTVFSANQSAEALNYMALAGYDAETSIRMLPNVLNLAAAGNFDLATASDMVTDAQTALGLSLDQTDTLIDQMAKTASRSNTSVSQLGEAILTVGGTASYLTGGTKEINTTLGALANNGIKGAEAGTKLRNMILSLTSPTKDASDLLNKLGVNVFDAEGNLRGFSEIFPELNAAMADFTDEQKLEAFSTLFNSRDIAAANALLKTTVADWAALGGEIENADGAAKEMAAVQLDNLGGDITLLKSAFEGFQIALGETLDPLLRPFIDALTSVFTFIADNEFAMDFLLGFLTTLGILLLKDVVPAIWASTTALLANPTTWIVLAVSALIAGLILLVTHIDEVGEFFKNVFGEIGEFVGGVIDSIIDFFGNLWDKVKEVFGKIKQFFVEFWDALKQLVFKVGSFIGETVSGIFKAAVNGVLSFIENFINSPIRLLNKFIGLINKAFGFVGVNIGLVGEISLPRLATGGLVTGVGTDYSDSNMYALSKGEYVVRAAAAREIGYQNLERMNETGELPNRTVQNYFTINGYDKSPEELATIISRKIALKTQGVLG